MSQHTDSTKPSTTSPSLRRNVHIRHTLSHLNTPLHSTIPPFDIKLTKGRSHPYWFNQSTLPITPPPPMKHLPRTIRNPQPPTHPFIHYRNHTLSESPPCTPKKSP
ncbi:hypothetical protein EJ04DRAFT_516601 [Polyplosphaeria fusca]|uniref:Uncharacterized protein n=1 Tax=Polyplosphaeria fusca TaxID=682080 RepID=A0A9P4QNZ9_9PLEO|nr:hypothetical protein EJ04DRAFT_516601 [Polyplosphaeria fusca]